MKMNEIMYYVILLFSALQQLPHFRGKTHTPSAGSHQPLLIVLASPLAKYPLKSHIRSFAHSPPYSMWWPSFRSPGLFCLLTPGFQRICSIILMSRLLLISSRAFATMDNLSYFSIYFSLVCLFLFFFCLPPTVKCKPYMGSDTDCVHGCIYPQGLELCLAHCKYSGNFY